MLRETVQEFWADSRIRSASAENCPAKPSFSSFHIFRQLSEFVNHAGKNFLFFPQIMYKTGNALKKLIHSKGFTAGKEMYYGKTAG
jgi:hypothetical protein